MSTLLRFSLDCSSSQRCRSHVVITSRKSRIAFFVNFVTPTGHTLVVYSCAWFGTDPTLRLVQRAAAANKTRGVNEEWTPIRQTRAEPHGRFRSVPCRPRVPTTAGPRSDRPGEEQTGERRLGAEPTDTSTPSVYSCVPFHEHPRPRGFGLARS